MISSVVYGKILPLSLRNDDNGLVKYPASNGTILGLISLNLGDCSARSLLIGPNVTRLAISMFATILVAISLPPYSSLLPFLTGSKNLLLNSAKT